MKIKVSLIYIILLTAYNMLEKNNNSQEVSIDIGSLGEVLLNKK